MDGLINVDDTQYNEAVSLHNQIMSNGTIAANALYEMCRCLKQMRDTKLYMQLGYEDFDNYCEQMAHIKRRQAYNYIMTYERLGKDLLQSNAGIGITKLELLTHVPDLDRAEFVADTDLGGISVTELEAKIEQLKIDNEQKGEQLTMLQEQVEAAEDKDEELDRLRSEIEQLKSRPVDVAMTDESAKLRDELKKAKADSKAEAKAAAELAVQKALDKERKEQAEAAEQRTAELTNQIEGYKLKLAERDGKVTEAMQKASELEERLKSAKRDSAAKFAIYFEQLNDVISKAFEAVGEIEEPERRKKCAQNMILLAGNIKVAADEVL